MHPEDRKKHHNRWYRITHYYQIQTKEPGVTTRLKLNPIQKKLRRLVDFWNHHLVLKARQEGVSTFFLLWHLDATLFTENCNTCILADCRENLVTLFQIIKHAYETCPAQVKLADGTVWHKPKARYDTRNELHFEGINSRIYVSLSVRSKTVHRLHVSEWAWIKHAQKVLTATFAAVPKTGVITGETTANGMGGSFYEEWENKQSRFMKHFFGFQDHPDYFEPVEDEEAFEKSLTADERAYLQRPNMELGNIFWMRMHLSVAANRKEFKQEYPSIPSEAFLTSGRSPFDREKIMDWIIRPPIELRMEGRLQYWVKPQKDRRYIMSTDAASGEGDEKLMQTSQKDHGTDYTVLQIWDCETLQLCCMFRGKWPYAKFHEIQYRLGCEYNMAYNITEDEKHGLTIINNFVRDYVHPGLYPRSLVHTTEYLDKKSQQPLRKWGWNTNGKTRPLIIDHMETLIIDELIRCHSEDVQGEFLKFIINDAGDAEAMEGYHDDCVLAACIALYDKNIAAALKATREAVTKRDLGLR
jgi:hypothetical protein